MATAPLLGKLLTSLIPQGLLTDPKNLTVLVSLTIPWVRGRLLPMTPPTLLLTPVKLLGEKEVGILKLQQKLLLTVGLTVR